mmetsp:Transcript_55930/g.117030  ORF Transcript_55930/g.117030 Transcript_55930/m.117030 type:complete len:222 (-) Transcript_55930:718-1383(-)
MAPSRFSCGVLRSWKSSRAVPSSLSTPASRRSAIPSGYRRRTLGPDALYLNASKGYCWLMTSSSRLKPVRRPSKMRTMKKSVTSSASVYDSLISISKSSPVNSVRCRPVWLFSARNTGPTSKTRSRSPMMAICLYSCGDCARHAGCSNRVPSMYLSLNTSAPPSLAPAMSFGVWISTNPFSSRAARNSWPTAELMRKMAFCAGTRRSMMRLSRRISTPTRT